MHDSPNWDLWLAKSDGTLEKAIFRNHILLSDSHVPAWSPDGKVIVIPIVQPTKTALGGLMAVDPANGTEQFVATPVDHIYHGPVWVPDGSALIASAMQADAEHLQAQMGYLNYPAGEYRQITSDTNDYSKVGMAKDGKTSWLCKANFVSRLPLLLRASPINYGRSLCNQKCPCGPGDGCRTDACSFLRLEA